MRNEVDQDMMELLQASVSADAKNTYRDVYPQQPVRNPAAPVTQSASASASSSASAPIGQAFASSSPASSSYLQARAVRVTSAPGSTFSNPFQAPGPLSELAPPDYRLQPAQVNQQAPMSAPYVHQGPMPAPDMNQGPMYMMNQSPDSMSAPDMDEASVSKSAPY